MWEKNIDPPVRAPGRDQTRNLGMCPNTESNLWTLLLWNDTQPTEPHHSGRGVIYSKKIKVCPFDVQKKNKDNSKKSDYGIIRYYKAMNIPIIQIEEYHWLHFTCSETIRSYEVIARERELSFQSH